MCSKIVVHRYYTKHDNLLSFHCVFVDNFVANVYTCGSMFTV